MFKTKHTPSRRTFLKDSGSIAGVSTLAGMTLPLVHAAENNTIQLALVGCGGRGPGAVGNPAGNKKRPLQPVALAAPFPPKTTANPRPPRCPLPPHIGRPPDRPLHGLH